MDLKDTDLLALKATQAKRDKLADDATSDTPAPVKDAAPGGVTFIKAGPKPTPAQKKASDSKLADLLKKRDADKAEYAGAWDEAK